MPWSYNVTSTSRELRSDLLRWLYSRLRKCSFLVVESWDDDREERCRRLLEDRWSSELCSTISLLMMVELDAAEVA